MTASARSPSRPAAADLVAYVPRHVVDELIRTPGWSPGSPSRFDAIGLFADMSGYTAMSEAFAARGAAGAEELGRLLNEHFDGAVDLVERFGGSVGKFGGDAVSAVFVVDERPDAPGRAVRCAMEIQEGMKRFRSVETSVGTFDLSCKIGLAIGGVLAATVSAPGGRLEWILAGSAVDGSAEAEHHALSGEVVCADAFRSRCAGLLTRLDRCGFWVIEGLERDPEPHPYPPVPPLSDDVIDILARFVHRSVAERVRMGHRDFVDEHRRIAVLFAGYGVLNTASDEGVHLLLERSAAALAAAELLDGYLHQIDTGDKGALSIISFGAAIAHEDDEERALACATEILREAPDASIGLAVGTAFCGELGGHTRREYAAIGDTMNIAARLMQLAEPGTVLCTGSIGRRARARAVLRSRPPVTVKGRRQPVAIVELQRLRDQPVSTVREPGSELPLVGRDEELARIDEAIEGARNGIGRVVLVGGEAGIGKSRLSAEAVSSAQASGFSAQLGAGSPSGASTLFLPWRPIVRSLLGLEAEGTGDIEAALETLDASLAPRAPLLGSILGESIQETPLTAGLEPQLRAELTTSLIADIVRVSASTTPQLLWIEDLQWLDPASQELLVGLSRQVRAVSVLVLGTYRSEPGGDALGTWASGLEPAERIELDPLSNEAMEAFLAVAAERLFGLRGAALKPLSQTLVGRAEGNALYLEELLNLCKDRGIDPTNERALAAAGLPEGLNRLVLARLDTLPQPEQMTLRVASVIGRRFAEPWLRGSYPALGSTQQIRTQMDRLAWIGLTRIVASRPEREHVFKHAVVHESAYATLSDSSRLAMHEAVARFVETTYGGDLGPYVGTLAYHYGATRNVEKQRHYFRRAADAATEAYANGSAAGYYERLLTIVSNEDAVEVSRLLGQVRQHAGDWGGAEEAFRMSLTTARQLGDERGAVRANSALGYLLAHTGSVAEARELLEQAVNDAERLADTEASTSALEYLSFAMWQLADYDASIAMSTRLVDLAGETGDSRAACIALESLGMGYWRRGDYGRAKEALERALDLADRIGDMRGLIHSANDLAGMLAETGDLAGAFAEVARALHAAREIGYRNAVATLIGNAAELYRQHGELGLALTCSLHSLAVSAPMRDWFDIVNRLGNMALTLADQGELEKADDFLAETVALAEIIEGPYESSVYAHYRADVLARLGQKDEASSLNDAALRRAREIDSREVIVRASVLEVRLAVQRGELATGEADADLARLERPDMVPTERAMLTYERWLLHPDDPDRRREATEAAHEIYRAMPGPEHARRLEELTGFAAPAIEPLPPLQGEDEGTMSLEDALTLVRSLLEERRALDHV